MVRAEAYLHAKFHPDPSNRLATIHQRQRQTDRTDRQRSDSNRRAVLQAVAQKCVGTEVVLFSTVAFKTLSISQGSVAPHLRCGGIFSDSIITNFLLILVVKKILKIG